MQIRGWGHLCAALCSRVIAETRALRSSSFPGLEFEQPVVMCCTPGCAQTVGRLQDLAASAMADTASTSAPAVKRCPSGHVTHLQPLVGIVPAAKDGHEAELRYWLRSAETLLRSGDAEDITMPPHVCMSLAAALVQWSASELQEDVACPSSCPRVWVAIRHRDASLVLRPVCEHLECLHAMRFKRRGFGILADVVDPCFARDDRSPNPDTGGTGAEIPLRQVAALSGRALAALTQDADYGDEAMQTLHEEDVSAGVGEIRTALPAHTMVPVKHLVSLHERLQAPLCLTQVLAHVPRPTSRHLDGLGGDDGSMSRLWLCKRHAETNELQQHRRREQEAIEAMSMRVQWFWHDGQQSHEYHLACNAKLEHAFSANHEDVVVRVLSSGVSPTTTHTVQLHALPMVVQETGARVVRISRVTYVTRSTKLVVS